MVLPDGSLNDKVLVGKELYGVVQIVSNVFDKRCQTAPNCLQRPPEKYFCFFRRPWNVHNNKCLRFTLPSILQSNRAVEYRFFFAVVVAVGNEVT